MKVPRPSGPTTWPKRSDTAPSTAAPGGRSKQVGLRHEELYIQLSISRQ